ncbi:MAG: 50S ribosomal protein L22 [Actinomycetota bacterium]
MTGPKLNEGATVAGERPGTRATAKYIRASASKAREVLDLIRGLDVQTADEVLQFTDRHIAADVRKVLASAVANAVNNDDQDAEELYVLACFADEGPTLRRFRPRARGRATRINKRTCHITVIVARMSDDRLELIQAAEERAASSGGRGRPQSSAASRRARVERSRQRSAEEDGEEIEDEVEELEDAVDEVAEESEVDASADDDTAAEGSASDEAGDSADQTDDSETDSEAESIDTAEAPDASADDAEAAEGSASDEAESAEENGTADEKDNQ